MLSCHFSSPMLVSCLSLIVSSAVASHCCELQVYHSVIFPVGKMPQFCKYTLYRHHVLVVLFLYSGMFFCLFPQLNHTTTTTTIFTFILFHVYL